MGCFDNYIALKGGCSEETLDQQGFFINHIGINREFIENIVNEDSLDVDDFFASKVSLAVSYLKRDIFSYLSPKFNTKSIIEESRIGYYQDNMILNPALAGEMKGVQMQLFESASYLNVFVSKIQLMVDFTGDVSVLVYDLKQNKVLDTLTVAALAGEVSTLIVNKNYSTESQWTNLAFLYESDFASYRSTTVDAGCSGCYKYFPFRLNKYVLGSGATIETADPKIGSNIEGNSDTGGLAVFYTLQCSQDDWLCTTANLFADALLYKTGQLIIDHALLYTSQQSSLNLQNRPQLEQRADKYETEYSKSMDKTLKNLRIPENSICFFCTKARMIATELPA